MRVSRLSSRPLLVVLARMAPQELVQPHLATTIIGLAVMRLRGSAVRANSAGSYALGHAVRRAAYLALRWLPVKYRHDPL